MLKNSPPYQIINTKFNRPPLGRRWNDRPRLIKKLDNYREKRLTLISAPAGYGKTTAAVQWAVQNPQFTTWLSVDKSDNDSERFIRYLTLAIKIIFPGFGSGITALLESPTLAPPDYLADAMISDVSIIDETLTIIIDDFHTVHDEAIHRFMIKIIQNLPVNLHLVILTRKDPPWPNGNFRAQGWIGEIRAVDLRFSEDESRNFLQSNSRRTVPAPVLSTLHRRTEGWVAGLQLALLSMDNVEKLEAFATELSGNDRFISDYLIGEALSGLPDEIRNFLSVTGLLNRFCAPLCDRLLPEGSDSSQLIAEVEKRNLFLVPLDNERIWFRYHHLFQTLLLRYIIHDQSPEQKRKLHFLAGRWFADKGLVEEALKHLIASGQIGVAAQLFGEHLHTTIQKDLTRRTLIRWLNMFPDEIQNEHPALLMARICYLTYQWNLPSILPLIEAAEIRLRNPACVIDDLMRLSLLAYVDALRGFSLYWQGDADGALRHTRRALEVLSREHSWAYTAGVIYKSASLAATGQAEEALEFLSTVIADDCSAGSRNVGTILVARMAIHLNAGNLTAVINDTQEVLNIHESIPVPVYWLSHAHYFLGSVAYEQNNLDVAAKYFRKVEEVIYQVNSRIYHECLLGLALVSNAKHELKIAQEYVNQAQMFAIQMNDPLSRLFSDSLKYRLGIMAEQEPLEPINLKATNESNKIWLEIPTMTLIECLIKRPDPDFRRVLSTIDEALRQAKQWHNKRQEIQFLAVKSVTLRCAGETDHALEILKETLQMAEPFGFVRSFVDRGPIIAELLNKLLNIRSVAQYARRLLDAFEDAASRKKAASAFINSPLTNRELKILKMLALRSTYKEIAANLSISSETVKSHATSIYRKLNASGRLEAIDNARKKGILPGKR